MMFERLKHVAHVCTFWEELLHALQSGVKQQPDDDHKAYAPKQIGVLTEQIWTVTAVVDPRPGWGHAVVTAGVTEADRYGSDAPPGLAITLRTIFQSKFNLLISAKLTLVGLNPDKLQL